MTIKKIDTLICFNALIKLEGMIESMTMSDMDMVFKYMCLTIGAMKGKWFKYVYLDKIESKYNMRVMNLHIKSGKVSEMNKNMVCIVSI